MMDEFVTRNFTLGEFVVSDTAARLVIDNTPPASVVAQLRNVTIPAMQQVREILAVPVFVISGYRCPELNRAVRGASTSQHVLGQAVDFKAPAYGPPRKVCELLVQLMARIKFDQLIYEGGWCHVSWSSAPRHQVLTAHFPTEPGGRVTYTPGLPA